MPNIKLRYSFFIILIFIDAYAQTCNDALPARAADSRYSLHGNGTVTDQQTGLMWQRCSQGLSGSDCGTGNASTLTWQQALQIPETLNVTGGYAGYTDWRLPNIKELATLTEKKCYAPAINNTVFPNTESSSYWSSSTNANLSSGAWYVVFGNGIVHYNSRNGHNHVRLVRSGQ